MTHAQVQIKARYGINPTPKFMKMLSFWIKTDAPQVSYKRHAGGRADIYIVRIRRRRMPIVWDRIKKYIITALPEENA